MKARVTVTLKSGVLDPQGQAITGSLRTLGFAGLNSVRQGKVFDIDIAGTDQNAARAALKLMCDRLLANTVIENYAIEILDAVDAPVAAAPTTEPEPAAAPETAPTMAEDAVPPPGPESIAIEPAAPDFAEQAAEIEAEAMETAEAVELPEVTPEVPEATPTEVAEVITAELADPQSEAEKPQTTAIGATTTPSPLGS